MKKIMLLSATLAVLMASCQSEEQADVVSSDEAMVSFGMNFGVEDAVLTRASHSFEYYVAVSAEEATDGNITSGYIGRFTSLSDASVALQKGTTYNFYISAFESVGATADLSTYCATQGEFVEVSSVTPCAPDFADTKVDRYYGSATETINTNTTVSITGKRFAYGINVNIETPTEGKVVMSSESPAFTYTVTSTDEATVENNIFCLAGTDEAASKEAIVTVKWYDSSNKVISSNTKVVTIARNHMKTLKVKALDPNAGFDFTLDEEDMEDDGEIEVPSKHEYVDLGVVVDGKPVYWATTNIGATLPADYGLYFAWGETVGYGSSPQGEVVDEYGSVEVLVLDGRLFDWASYSSDLCGGDYDKMKKYCTDSEYGIVDNKTVLDPEDDAAHVNWQGAWRMPTAEELDALRTQCTWTWTTMINSAGEEVNGYKVSNKSNSSKFIFLPTAGRRYYGDLYYAGSYGYYWSSSLHTSNSNFASYLYFDSGDYDWYDRIRCYGQSVRPVCQ